MHESKIGIIVEEALFEHPPP